MKFPSPDFDDAVGALCHGQLSDERLADLHAILRASEAARDEYLWQVELHSRLYAQGVRCKPVVDRPRGKRSSRDLVRWAAAVLLLATAGMLAFGIGRSSRPGEAEPTIESRRDDATRSAVQDEGVSAPSFAPGPSAVAMGIIPANVRFAYAADFPVVVGTGRMEPIHLGAYVPYTHGGDTLHAWEWPMSAESRVYEQVRLWEHQRFAVTPDGRQLVWSDGTIFHMRTGERSRMDLGGAMHFSRLDERLRRIQDLQFSPDGGRLALLVSTIELKPTSHALRKHDVVRTEVIQVVDFPSGGLLCEVPAGDTMTLRIGFSADGSRILSKVPAEDTGYYVVEYEVTTGDLVRRYEPPSERYVYAIAVSPDGSRVVAYDGAGALFVWKNDTGELEQRITDVRHASFSTLLRFSPDSRFVAVDALQRVHVVDLDSGTIAGSIPQSNAGEIYWSADGERLTVVTKFAHGERDGSRLFNVYPAVYEWEWRTETMLRDYSRLREP